MTRYARARGSKSSNERLPEEATSWQVMKRQLQDAQQTEDIQHYSTERIQDILKNDSVNDNNLEWAEFEIKPTKQVKRKNMNTLVLDDDSDRKEFEMKSTKQKKKQKRMKTLIEIEEDVSMELNQKKDMYVMEGMHKKGRVEQGNTKKIKTPLQVQKNDAISGNKNQKRRKKFNRSHDQREAEESSKESFQADCKTINSGDFRSSHVDLKGTTSFKKNSNDSKFQQTKKVYKRRKPDIGNHSMFINGREVPIVRFDGFFVKREDAQRLKELRQKMIDKKIPRDEIKRAIKLERRKAEKALAHEKKKVCFQCRNYGHNLSECPQLGDGKNENSQAVGICFKCGSTEHTHYECRVNRSEGFQFAKCFVCNEQGHIARQCPDNPRGLYPKGGGCRVCGDVTHLKKDCPDLIQEKKDHTITADTMKKGVLEGLDEDIKKTQQQLPSGNKRKHIQF